MAKNNFFIKAHSKVEREYCEKHNIELNRLKNGITLFGTGCQMDCASWARILWTFDEGAFRNTAGAVHFLEHLFNKKIVSISEKNSLYFNAHTSQTETSEEISGVANPNFRNFGVWKALGAVRKALESPTKTVPDINETVKSERQVIKAEVRRCESDHNFQIGKHVRDIIYSKENPLCDDPPVLGTEIDLDKINAQSLKEIQEKILVPSNLFISFYSEGPLSIAKNLAKELKNDFSDFPREDRLRTILDKSLLEKTNSSKLSQGKEYLRDHGLKNRIITYEFVWIFDYSHLSKGYLSLNILRDLIWHHLHDYSRKKGWGYNTDVYVSTRSYNIQIVSFRVDFRKGDEKNILKEIKEVIGLARKNVKFLATKERARQLATPLSVSDRISWADSLQEFGEIIDADKVRSAKLELTTHDYLEVVDKLAAIDPFIFITGDLS